MRTIRDCNCVVVGGAGFLGSHLVDHLIEDRGCRVLVIDNLCSGRREFVHKKASFIHADITISETFLTQVFCDWAAAFVFNYAAHPYIPDSFARPHHVFQTNANGAINVINAAQDAGAEGILQVSSAELYGGYVSNADHFTMKMDEKYPVEPRSTYGASKAAVDYYCQSAWRERKTPVIALRQFNCCGERETHPYVIPEIISQVSKFLPAFEGTIAHGSGTYPTVKLGNNSTRDFTYAGDAVRIAVELLERGEWGQVYNLGSETGIKIYDLARLIGKVMGFADVQVEKDESRVRPWEIWHLQSDNTKLWNTIGRRVTYHFNAMNEHPSVKSIGFDPGDIQSLGADVEQLTPLEESLRRTIKWFKEQGLRWPWEG